MKGRRALCDKEVYIMDSQKSICGLVAERLTTGEYPTGEWTVVDRAGGRWWPDTDGQREAQASSDPGAVVMALCLGYPMRGVWVD